MKSFNMKSAPGAMLKASLRTIGMGLGHPKARPLVLEFKPAHETLKTARTLFIEADDALIVADADCELVAALCYEDVDEMQIVLEGVVKKDWQDPLYRAFFPDGLTDFKDQSPEALKNALAGFIQTLKDAGNDKLRKYVPTFEAHSAALDKPLGALAKARVRAASAELVLDRAKLAWLDAYTGLEGGFIKAFPRQKKFIARFFPVSSGPSGAKKKEGDGTETGDDAEAGAAPKTTASGTPGPVASGTAGPPAQTARPPATDAPPAPSNGAGAEKPRS